MMTMTKNCAIGTSGDELVFIFRSWGITEVEEAVTVEGRGVREDGGVGHGNGPDGDVGVLGN